MIIIWMMSLQGWERLGLPHLLAAIGGQEGEDDGEALLGLLALKASTPSLLRVQQSLSRVGSALPMTGGSIQEEEDSEAEGGEGDANRASGATTPTK